MATFTFELVSPEKVLLSADAELAVLPGADGEMGVMAGHAPVITTLTSGMIRVRLAGGTKDIFIKGGFAEITANAVTVLVERAFITDDVDHQLVDSELRAAEVELAAEPDDEARRNLNKALEALRSLRRAA